MATLDTVANIVTLFGLYTWIDLIVLMLLSTKVSPFYRGYKTKLARFCQHSTSSLLWHIHLYGNFGTAPINHPALIDRALPCNIGENSTVNFLPSLIATVIKALGAFGCLGKNLQYLFDLFYNFWGVFVPFCLSSGGCTLRSTYTIRVNIIKPQDHRLLYIETIVKFVQ